MKRTKYVSMYPHCPILHMYVQEEKKTVLYCIVHLSKGGKAFQKVGKGRFQGISKFRVHSRKFLLNIHFESARHVIQCILCFTNASRV